MPVTAAQENRHERYDRWSPLLLDELALVAKPSCTSFAISRAAEDYLKVLSTMLLHLRMLHQEKESASTAP
jgi:hypothetical protein